MPPLEPGKLWPIQINAIQNLEASLAANRPRAVIQMTMGSGKTFTACSEAYRLIKLADASHMETGKLPTVPACLRCGLSVFRELRDAVHQRQLLPKLGRFIAQAELVAEHGKTELIRTCWHRRLPMICRPRWISSPRLRGR